MTFVQNVKFCLKIYCLGSDRFYVSVHIFFLLNLQNFIIYSSIMTDSNDDEFDSPDLELDQHEIYPLSDEQSDEWQEDTGNYNSQPSPLQ